ncbi:hypothetical protein [Acinetobacter sp. Ver3]|uniref:hypothetical protein n=1 Tax=Acinetobacter sp. Ver3 TaxID=466088 RepID=UPI0004488E1C|nr:hypothetical protein [Acinetobacter sp. Ver3]EZQ06689.1 hypothetical protein CL42_10090 [Acinetobacter sp. Ver3]
MQKNKTIWVVLRSHLITLPPVMTVINCLLNTEEYNVKLVSTKESEINHPLYEEFIIGQTHKVGLAKKISNYYFFRKFVQKTFTEKLKEDDLVWIASLDTAQACKGLSFLDTNKYILHLHELYDNYPKKLNSIKEISQKAYKIVVPELNRARILQVWLQLKERPTVLPNKPWTHPRTKYMIPTHESTKEIIKNYDSSKKIIIYQGHIEKGRSLEPIIEAISDIDNVEFWLMGIDHGYVAELLKMSDKVKYWGYVPAPYHLEVTSYADIGIMSYDLINLNHMYCAPNKVWEYLGFNLFFICNEVGSLDSFKLHGCCDLLDFKNKNDIKLSIVKNLQVKHNFSNYYDSVNLDEILKNILKAKSESLNESTKI